MSNSDYRHPSRTLDDVSQMGVQTRMFTDAMHGRPFAILSIGGTDGGIYSQHITLNDAWWLARAAADAVAHLETTDDD